MKFKTVLEGEQAVIYNYLGEGKLIKGPARVFLFRERLEKLRHYTAGAYQYLRIKDIQGYVTHRLGPCDMFLSPLEHCSISVCDATQIDANHVVVVYKKLKDNSVERRIVSGPTIFMPQAEEWLHCFKWHGSDPNNKGRMVPDLDSFTQLNVIPSHFYYTVRDVRTTDDIVLSVKLLIFYEIKDVLTLLENTQDPIADLTNALCADVIAFAGKRKLSDFLENTDKLSGLKLYTQLLQRATRVGFVISKVVFRGYHADDKLQAMQDATIKSRSEMRTNVEIQNQEQRLKDFKLQMEHDRSKLIQEMEQSKQEHLQKVETLQQTHALDMQKMEHEAALKQMKMENQTKLDLQKQREEHELSHYRSLSKLGVDITQYLVQGQEVAPNEEFRIVQMPASSKAFLGPSGGTCL